MTVGIAGWYRKGNFGDDLMAMMFAKELRSHGFDVLLWGIRGTEAEQWGATSTSQIEEFVSSIDVLVLGGGGLLANASVEDRFDRFLSTLVREAEERSIPIHGISLGGDGTLSPKTISPGRKALLNRVGTLTVRNKRDVADVRACGADATFAHDIVWICGQYTDMDIQQDRQRERVLVNVEEKSTARKLYIVAVCGVQAITTKRKFSFLNIIREENPHHRLQQLLSDSGLISYHQITGVDDCLNRIKQSSLVISSKMHIGVVAFSLGIPFISVFGEPKTKIMLKGIGTEYCYRNSILSVTKSLIDATRPSSLPTVKGSVLDNIKDSSKKHFRLLLKTLK